MYVTITWKSEGSCYILIYNWWHLAWLSNYQILESIGGFQPTHYRIVWNGYGSSWTKTEQYIIQTTVDLNNILLNKISNDI